jgi:hypothetical protein
MAAEIEAAIADIHSSIQKEAEEVWAGRDQGNPAEAQAKIAELNSSENILRRKQYVRERIKLKYHLASFEQSLRAQRQNQDESDEDFEKRLAEMQHKEYSRLAGEIERLGLADAEN